MKILTLALLSLALWGCSQMNDTPTSQPSDCPDGKCKPRVDADEEIHCSKIGEKCPIHDCLLTWIDPRWCKDCQAHPKCAHSKKFIVGDTCYSLGPGRHKPGCNGKCGKPPLRVYGPALRG